MKTPVAVLGATGMVGQRMIRLLHEHPTLELAALCASERSAGRDYSEAAPWRLDGDPPPGLGTVLACAPEALPPGVRVVLSALPTKVAAEVEPAFANAGYAVVSNASAFRQDPRVPLLIPELNADHLSLIDRWPGPGFIVTNPNCCALPLALTLGPLHRRWGVEAMCVSTWQAVSGAGYPGESAYDMVGNVHPHPGSEEHKLTLEPARILGTADQAADFVVSARCVRVPTLDGHMVSAQIRFRETPTPTEVATALRDFQPDIPELPSSPSPVFHVLDELDRPQPRRDILRGGGMAVSVGRIERCPVMGIKLYCLAHNTIRGAAGAAIQNVELLQALGRLPTGP